MSAPMCLEWIDLCSLPWYIRPKYGMALKFNTIVHYSFSLTLVLKTIGVRNLNLRGGGGGGGGGGGVYLSG